MDADGELAEKRKNFVKLIKSFFSSEDKHDELNEKRQKVISFVKEKKVWIIYIILAIIILSTSYMRTTNFWLLKDVTTGNLVSVDLDSHIYLKYAKLIQKTGYLTDLDTTRFVPIGAATANYAFPAYVIYYLYTILHFFNSSVNIEYADVLYPVISFAISMLFFFLLVRKIFNVNVALVATLFLSIMPSFLFRTMGGSSDHDALGMMFTFISFYLFLLAWEAKTYTKAILIGGVAGLMTGLTGLSWGAWKFVGLIFALFALIELLFMKTETRHNYLYIVWFVVSIITMIVWVPLFPLKSLVTSITTIPVIFMVFVFLVDLVVFKYDLFKFSNKIKHKLPASISSIIIAASICIIALSIIIGPTQVSKQLSEAKLLLLHPMGKDRWELTVAEQHQPYFYDITSNFGPYLFGVPIFYAFSLLGIFFVVYSLLNGIKNRWIISIIIMYFFLGLNYTRNSPGHIFDGNNSFSKIVYLGSMLLFAALIIWYSIRSYGKEKVLSNSGLIFALVWMFFMAIAARGALRLIFIFTPVVVLFASYAIIKLGEIRWKSKSIHITILVLLLLLLFNPFNFPVKGITLSYAQETIKSAKYFGPPYNQQWQVAGKWVRDNTPVDAVFAHWWDYGYWVQNGFERSSVLDGANKVKYWNYLMGRLVLTGQNQDEALKFLYTHNTTHFLIVSEEIGKYTAYSSIGSDENYDRYSWITTFALEPKSSQETKDQITYFYRGGHTLDDDFTYNGVVYPRQQAGIGAILVPIETQEGNQTHELQRIGQPSAIIGYNGGQANVPLKCLYINGKMIKFDKEGLGGCFRLVPTLDGNGKLENPIGAGLYVSEKGVKALWTNLYIFDQNNPDYDTSAFELKYGSETSGVPLVLYQGRIIGPIKIWEIKYTTGFNVSDELKQRYLGGNEYLPDYFFKV